jgi:hypothetical protein
MGGEVGEARRLDRRQVVAIKMARLKYEAERRRQAVP